MKKLLFLLLIPILSYGQQQPAQYPGLPVITSELDIVAWGNIVDTFVRNQYDSAQDGSIWITDTIRADGAIGAGYYLELSVQGNTATYWNAVAGGHQWRGEENELMSLNNDGLLSVGGLSSGFLMRDRTTPSREWLFYPDGTFRLYNNFNGPLVDFGYVSGDANFLFDVGIGVASPTERLDVNGNIKANQTISFFMPVTSTDAAAPNNSIYYSTDASKLVYKDSGGVVNALY